MGVSHSAEVAQLADSNLQFALDLLKESGDGKGNVLVSPFGLSAALAMVFGGAKSHTALEMKEVLQLDSFEDESVIHEAYNEAIQTLKKVESIILLVANRLYVQDKLDIQHDYRELLEKSYQSDVGFVDFSSNSDSVRLEINEWVEKFTNSMVKNTIWEGVLDSVTRSVLVNGIYFKGDWAQGFEVETTEQADFHLDASTTVTVDMMYMYSTFPYKFDVDLVCEIIELPFASENLGMYILLPKELEGLRCLEDNLDAGTILQLIESMANVEMHLRMPKFKLESTLFLSETLSVMGMPSLFTEGIADLSGITSSEKLHVAQVVHKTVLDVDEQGMETSSSIFDAYGIPESYGPPPNCTMNRPFLLMIRDKSSGVILMLGRVTNPTM